jgi:hypothetical protein
MTDSSRRDRLDRRGFLIGAAHGLAGAAALGPGERAGAREDRRERPRVAALVTEFTHRSHAHVILENFLNPYLFNGRRTEPGVEVVSLYVDQFPANDMARQVARERNIPIFPTIAEALAVGGSGLAVDAVLSIGEHGRYPVNAKGQREYPRKRFFDEVVKVFEASGRSVPVFNDKHLSYRWDWAKEMYDTARRLGFALTAGSSVPLAERRPPLELPGGARIRDAVSIHGGPVESYDFHGLEVLQSLVESRRGGERGVASVRFLSGDALLKAADGHWSPALADAAMAAELGPGQPPIRELVQAPKFRGSPHGMLVTYVDGFRAIALKVGQAASRWNFACSLDGETEPRATSFYVGPWDNRNLFKALSHAIQECFRTGRSPYPIERTLLTTGILDAAMDSRLQGGKTIETPHLAIAYVPVDFRPMREMGATWRIITPGTPEPKGLDTIGRDVGR